MEQNQQQQPARILRIRQVIEKTGYKHASIYRKIQDGTFPAPLKLGAKASGWLESDIDGWIAGLVRGVSK